MFKNLLIASIAALFVSIVSAQASTVTIDFGTDERDLAPNDIYEEDGFRFSVVSGYEFAIINDHIQGVFDDNSEFVVGQHAPVEIGDTVSITAINGGYFTFDSVDYKSGSDSGKLSDGINLEGWRDGALLFTILDFNTTAPDWETLTSVYGQAIDELKIVAASIGLRSLRLDNFEFSEVPLPAAVWMFIAGLGGLGFARKRGVA